MSALTSCAGEPDSVGSSCSGPTFQMHANKLSEEEYLASKRHSTEQTYVAQAWSIRGCTDSPVVATCLKERNFPCVLICSVCICTVAGTVGHRSSTFIAIFLQSNANWSAESTGPNHQSPITALSSLKLPAPVPMAALLSQHPRSPVHLCRGSCGTGQETRNIPKLFPGLQGLPLSYA